jgi:glycolate dehydrogenase FAD-linked subunit
MQEVSPENVAKYFEDILGAQNVVRSDSAAQMEDYAKDMGDYPSSPSIVIKPRTTEEVSQIVKYARRNKIPVIARGGGTSLTGALSSRGGILIDFSKRMNHVLRIDTVNWFVHCEPGITIDDLNAELRKRGFFFPPDPSSAAWCTVGGAIAENSGGMKCFRYGTVKDWVLALKVVLSDGSTVVLGEPLPKNRVGYDLVHLICGSEGTLAVITEAWLKMVPIPIQDQEHKSILVFFDEWRNAGNAIQAIRINRIQPVLLEFLDRESVKSVNDAFDLKIPENEATLFIETDSRATEILRLCEENGSKGNYIAKDEKDRERLYNARALIYLGVRSLGLSMQAEDVVVPIDRLPDYLAFVKSVSKKFGLKIPTAGHAGDGNVHPILLYNKDSEKAAKQAFAAICNYAIEVGGSVSGEHGIGEQKIEFANDQLSKHGGEQAIVLMRKLKKDWDPENIFNPGKFIKEA